MKFPTQSCRDYFISQYKDPVLNQPVQWNVIRVLITAHLSTGNVFSNTGGRVFSGFWSMFKKGRFLLHKVSGVGGGGVKLVTRFEGAVSKLMGSQVTDGDWRSQIPDPCEKTHPVHPSIYRRVTTVILRVFFGAGELWVE